MSWPTLTDYCAALQHPATCFTDPELQHATARTDKFGNPRGPAGFYAAVYQMTSGASTWAVKCFTSHVPDQHERYAAISHHIVQARLPYTVSFQYLPDGIRLHGFPRRTFPILKMEWVTGKQLDEYIRDNLYNEQALQNLAQQWLAMMRALRTANIGHGDLQHGNVKVAPNGELRLLDYDGMTVPALLGRQSIESGHRNYQHPLRRSVATQIGPDIDNFSAWSILLSIVATKLDATTWYRTAAGDDSLLFKQTDFDAPEQSEAFRLLEHSTDLQLRALASTFRHFLYVDQLTKIPSLDDVTLPDGFDANARRKGHWIDDHVTISPATPYRTSTNTLVSAATPPSEWSIWRLRIECLLLLLLALVAPQFVTGATLVGIELAIFILPLTSYLVLTELVGPGTERRRLRKIRRVAQIAIMRAEKTVKDLLDAEARATRDEHAKLAELNGSQQQVTQKEKGERDRLYAVLQRTLADLRARRGELPARENHDRATELERVRNAYVAQRLSAFRVEQAPLENIGYDLVSRLARAGIRTAADIVDFRVAGVGSFVLRSGTLVHVSGFGEVRGKRVAQWVRDTAARLEQQGPRTLDVAKDAEIRQRYQREFQQLVSSEAAAQAKAQQDLQTIASKYRSEQDSIAQKVHATRQQIAKWRADNQRTIQRYRQDVATRRAEVAWLDAELAPLERRHLGALVRRVGFLD